MIQDLKFKEQLLNDFIPRVEAMEEKEREHLHYLIDIEAPLEFIQKSQQTLFHFVAKIKELKDYQETYPTLPITGLLSPKDLIEFDQNGKHPDSWCQGTNQEGFERREWVVENNTLVPLIELLEGRAKELLQYPWQDYDIENDDKIRIVFWFDN